MPQDVRNHERQIWATTTSKTHSHRYWCTPLILPTGGVLIGDNNSTTTLTARATFKLPCDSDQTIISPDTTGNDTVIGFSKPFYASISPQTYALGACTVISYILIILIFITPRTFYVGGPGGGSGFLSRSGLISGGSNSIVGVGRRPLLQKIAALLVAISLTIATADTFNVARSQYDEGYIDSASLVEEVLNSTEIRVVRIISDTFLWLAQVQTLIRLFPRHKEKVTIKWLGFALVVADTVFSILDSFVSDNWAARPRKYTDAIPALNYLFELAISLIYASCVIFYSLSKRRFAFWHPKMRNICLVALISYVAIVIPVVFFILDITTENIAVWGEYIRWVGAAAASVVVWEWVERIESLERDERKDGILGREIFDGDEMLESTMSDDGQDGRRDGGDVEKNARFVVVQRVNQLRAKMPLRRRRKRGATEEEEHQTATGTTMHQNNTDVVAAAAPLPTTTPPSRSDTASAASTVYAVRYVNLTSPSPAVPDVPEEPAPEAGTTETSRNVQDTSDESAASMAEKDAEPIGSNHNAPNNLHTQFAMQTRQFWQSVSNPFKRRRAEPPAEIAGAQVASGIRRSPIEKAQNLKERFGAFAKERRDRFHGHNESVDVTNLPVMTIPAPRGEGRTWSPDDVRHSSAAGQLGEDTMDGQPKKDTNGESRQDESNVVVIPAPTSGRTWSPPDPPRSAQTTSRATTRATASPNGTASTPNGSQGTGRESQTPGSTAMRRSLTTNPVHVPPIAERLDIGGEGLGSSQDVAFNEPQSQALNPRSEIASTTFGDSGASGADGATAPAPVGRSTANVAPENLDLGLSADTAKDGDGRDSGGTNPATP